MAGRRYEPPMDPSVAPVEELLEQMASRSSAEPTRRDGRLIVSHAVWLCACETFDDAPTWLIYATDDGGIGWERVPEGPDIDVEDVVDAEHLTGCHPDPEAVLLWLRGERPRPWRRGGGDYPEDDDVYDEITRRFAA